MNILNLKVTNFGPYTSTQEISFEEIHAAIVGGPNEAGKSTFFIDAPLFALKGKMRSNNNGVINDNANNAEVALTFLHSNEIYTVTRKVKRDKPQELKLYQHDENGKQVDISERLLSNTQKKLDEILGFSYELLISTAVTEQDEINKLSTMTPSEREKIITEMLALGIWEKKKKLVQEKLNDLKKNEDQIDELETQLEVCKGQKDDFLTSLKSINDSLTVLSTQHSLHTKELVTLEEQFKERDKYGALQTRVTEITTKLQGMKQRLSQLGSPGDPGFITGKIQELDFDLGECDQLLVEIDKALVIYQQNLEANTKNKNTAESWLRQQSRIGLLNEVPCRTLPDIHEACKLLTDARQTRDQLNQYVNSIAHVASTIEGYIEKVTALQAKSKAELDHFTSSKTQIQQRKLENSVSKKELEQTIKNAEEAKKLTSEIKLWEGELRVSQNSLDALPKVNTDQLISTRRQVSELDRQISELKIKQATQEGSCRALENFEVEATQKLEKLSDVKKRVATYRTLLQAYTDIPTLLFMDIIPHIENHANQILANISPDRRISLRAYRDTKAGTQTKALDVIGTTQTGTRNFSDLSGSAKFRQSLALRIALAKVNAELYNTQIGFFILDEGLGSLDPINTVLVKEALRKAADHFELFIVISHIPDFEDTFDTRVLVNAKSKVQVIKQKASSEVALDV